MSAGSPANSAARPHYGMKGSRMHQELLRELSVITEEEQKILDGRQEIDPQIYTEKKDRDIDSGKLLPRVKLFTERPHMRLDD